MTAPGPGRLTAVAGIPRFMRDQLAGFRVGWKTYGDLYHVDVAGRDLWVCSHPDQVKEILVEDREVWGRIEETRWGRPFGLRMALGEGLLTTDGAGWAWRRHLMNPAFHRELVKGMVGMMIDCGEAMLSRLDRAAEAGQPVDLLAETKHVTQDIISKTMFSADMTHESGDIGAAVDEALRYVAKRSRSLLDLPFTIPSPAKRRFERSMRKIDHSVYRAIARRRASGVTGRDLLGLLLDATDEVTGEAMTDEQIRNEMATIYGAGHETTANALAWAWHELMQSPTVRERVAEEVASVDPADVPRLVYTRMVFEETLRYRPPVPVNGRQADRAARLGGFEVASGATALLVVTNIHRHPAYWEKPDRFDPDHFAPEAKRARDRFAYIPFGAGQHMCIGSNFAMVEGVVLLAMMAGRFEFAPVVELPREQATAVTMKPAGGLPVLVRRRKALSTGSVR